MIEQGIFIIKEAYGNYYGTGIFQVLMLIAIALILAKHSKKENKHLAFYALGMGALICIPGIAWVVSKYFIGDEVYWRMFWLLPEVLLIAYGTTKLSEELRGVKKGLFLICTIALIAICGKNLYTEENFVKSSNDYKIPQEVIEVCDMIYEGERIRVIVPESIISYVRQYNPNIRMIYGRSLAKEKSKGAKYNFMLELNSDYPDIEHIATYAAKKKCKYVVFDKNSYGTEKMSEYQYSLFGETENYYVYVRN